MLLWNLGHYKKNLLKLFSLLKNWNKINVEIWILTSLQVEKKCVQESLQTFER